MLERSADGFVADLARGDALGEADFGGQFEGPDAARLAEGARALVQQRAQAFASLVGEHSWSGVRTRRFGLQGGQTALRKIVNGVADGLVVAAQGTGNRSGVLAVGAFEQHLAATGAEATRRVKTGFQGDAFVGAERSDK